MEFRKRTENALKAITANGHTHHLHRRWLETLSYLESCGHRKIAFYQPPRNASLSLLKHAAEEARHAYFSQEADFEVEIGPTTGIWRKFGPVRGDQGEKLPPPSRLKHCEGPQNYGGPKGEKAQERLLSPHHSYRGDSGHGGLPHLSAPSPGESKSQSHLFENHSRRGRRAFRGDGANDWRCRFGVFHRALPKN